MVDCNFANTITTDNSKREMKLLTYRRNKAFVRECNKASLKAIGENPLPTTQEIINRVLRNGAPGYFVDIDRAEKVLNGLLEGGYDREAGGSLRKKMWIELLEKLKGTEGGIRCGRVRRSFLAFILKNSRASSFFISPSYGRQVYFESKKSILNN